MIDRRTIIIPDEVVGYKCGYPVIIRSISPGKTIPHKFEKGVFSMKTISPPLHLVVWVPKRLDAFLNIKNAKRYAKKFLNV